MKKNLTSFGSLNQFFLIFICLFCVVSVYRDFHVYEFLDTIEHIRASLAVSFGFLPYVDFFEHHHPLLWYILAPLAKVFYLNIAIIPVFRIIGTLSYLACIYIAYQINKKHLYGSSAAKFSTLCVLSVPMLWMDISNLRPDSFMLLFFLIGIKYYFDYVDLKKRRNLIISYIAISVSFLFLQKSLFLIFVFGGYNLYALIKKEIVKSDFVVACICGILPILIYLCYLFYYKMWPAFFYYNYTFNAQMQDYYGDYISGVPYFLKILAFFLCLFIIRTYHFSMKTGLLFGCFLISGVSLIYFAPHSWYYIPYFMFGVMLIGNFVNVCNRYRFIIIGVCVFSLILMYPLQDEAQRYRKYMRTVSNIVEQNMQDDMMDFRILRANIFSGFQDFYWFGFHNVVIVDEIYHQDKHFDPNDEVKAKKPKYLALESSHYSFMPFDTVAKEKAEWFMLRNRNLMRKLNKYPVLRGKIQYIETNFWKIDETWIKENYEQIKGTDVYKRKD